MHRTDRIAAGADALEVFRVQRAQVGSRAVGQNDLECVHMIDRLPIAQRARAGRIVADHPADRRPVARRDIRGEHQPERLQMRIELVEDDARLDPHRHGVAVNNSNPVQVLGEVNNDTRADGLPRKAGGGASRNDRHALVRGDRDGGDNVLCRSGHDHAERLDLIETGVGRIQAAHPGVEVDLGA